MAENKKTMGNLQQNIDRFFLGIEQHIATLETTNFDQANNFLSKNLYAKALYVCLIDTLAKSVYPNKGNRYRFTNFVKEFCDWPNCNKISLPHIVKLLKKVPDPAFTDLRKYVFDLQDKWPPAGPVYLDQDPAFDKIKKLWPKQQEHLKPIKNICIETLTHVELLYKCRNSVVHEMRLLGQGLEIPSEDGDKPFYSPMLRHQQGQSMWTWELIYPLDFFNQIVKEGKENLRVYFEAKKLDPLRSFPSGTYWIKELNKQI